MNKCRCINCLFYDCVFFSSGICTLKDKQVKRPCVDRECSLYTDRVKNTDMKGKEV